MCRHMSKPTSPKKSSSPVKTTPTPGSATRSRRKNARPFDVDLEAKADAVLSTRGSTALKDRTVAAAPVLGLKNHSAVISYALARLFHQMPQIIKAHRKHGTLPMSLVA